MALVTIDRPEVRNALDFALLAELAGVARERWTQDGTTRAVVLTGAGDKAFAAGADIVELADQTPERLHAEGHFTAWDRIAAVGLPVIAAVRGYALGGGCELAMSCDLLVAGDDARFGQPEIRIGVMPGAGGTQRLTRAIGRARAMDMILTGRTMDAAEAFAAGLVTCGRAGGRHGRRGARRSPSSIAAMPPLAVRAAKRAVRSAEELPLSRGAGRRALGVLRVVRDRGSARGHARVHGQAIAGVDRTMIWRHTATGGRRRDEHDGA